jgi:hypothetical protein
MLSVGALASPAMLPQELLDAGTALSQVASQTSVGQAGRATTERMGDGGATGIRVAWVTYIRALFPCMRTLDVGMASLKVELRAITPRIRATQRAPRRGDFIPDDRHLAALLSNSKQPSHQQFLGRRNTREGHGCRLTECCKNLQRCQ